MKTVVNGKTYLVGWKHRPFVVRSSVRVTAKTLRLLTTEFDDSHDALVVLSESINQNIKISEETICTIRTEDNNGNLYEIAQGSVKRKCEDCPNRVLANHLSLQKALFDATGFGSLINYRVYKAIAEQLRAKSRGEILSADLLLTPQISTLKGK